MPDLGFELIVGFEKLGLAGDYRYSNVAEDDYRLKNSQAASLDWSAVCRNCLLNLIKLLGDGRGSGLEAVKTTHQQLVRLLGSQMCWAVTSVITFLTTTSTSITTKSLFLTFALDVQMN